MSPETLGRRECEEGGCSKQAVSGGTPHCIAHGGGKRCQHEGCSKSAVGGGTDCCSAHRGGRRCHHEGCPKGAQGSTFYCKAHGGGRRCQHAGCSKSAVGGGTDYCVAHGGGRRCQEEGCPKSARGDTQHCVAHGGGRRCHHKGCTKGAEGDTQHCIAHGGGKRCQHLGCPKSAAGGGTQNCKQAVPERGLHQARRQSSRQCVLQAVSPARAARRCVAIAWRGPAAPSHGWDRGRSCESSTGGGWRVRGHSQASNRSDVQHVYNVQHEPVACEEAHATSAPPQHSTPSLRVELSRYRHPATVSESNSTTPTH